MTKNLAKSIDASRGTLLWGFNQFRTDILSGLLDDLMLREKEGLEKPQCKQVQQALGKFVHAATTIPDGGFLKGPIWKELEEFENIYVKWNGFEGTDKKVIKNRTKALKALRHRRHRLSRKIRNNQHILVNELDNKLIDSIYGAVGDLTSSLPDILKNLSKAFSNYKKKNNNE